LIRHKFKVDILRFGDPIPFHHLAVPHGDGLVGIQTKVFLVLAQHTRIKNIRYHSPGIRTVMPARLFRVIVRHCADFNANPGIILHILEHLGCRVDVDFNKVIRRPPIGQQLGVTQGLFF